MTTTPENPEKTAKNARYSAKGRRSPATSVQCTELHRNAPESSLRATAGATGQSEVARALPSDLQAVVDAWGTLPQPVKAGILAMVKASGSAIG
jgi:hypothetical protein